MKRFLRKGYMGNTSPAEMQQKTIQRLLRERWGGDPVANYEGVTLLWKQTGGFNRRCGNGVMERENSDGSWGRALGNSSCTEQINGSYGRSLVAIRSLFDGAAETCVPKRSPTVVKGESGWRSDRNL